MHPHADMNIPLFFLGIANRLAFALGFQVRHVQEDVTDSERRVKRLVMTACVMFDRHWALLLGRPTSIKNQDLGFKLLSKQGSSSQPMVCGVKLTSPPSIDDLVHDSLVELMDLAAKIADSQNISHNMAAILAKTEADCNAYLQAVTLDQQLQAWYRRLPDQLSWIPANIKSAPFSFFMLHQQYHTCMILLYRPWAKYGPVTMEGIHASYRPNSAFASQTTSSSTDTFSHGLGSSGSVDDEGRVALSRRMCTQHAVRVARIFWHHRQRGFDGRKISVLGIQHAGASALALMASLAHRSPDLDQRSNLSYLHVLSTAIYDMSNVYQPAARMYHLLKSILADIRAKLVPRTGSLRTSLGQNMDQAPLFGSSSTSWQGASKNMGNSLFSFQQGRFAKSDDISSVLHPSKKRRLGPESRRASEVAYPTSSFFKAANDNWYLDTVNNGSSRDGNKTSSLGKHDHHCSQEDIQVSGVGSLGISEDVDLIETFDFGFLRDSSVVADLSQQEQTGAKGEAMNTAHKDGDINAATKNAASSCGTADAEVKDEQESRSEDEGRAKPQDVSTESPDQKEELKEGESKVSSESVDATIEEWLAEPPGLTPSSVLHDTTSSGSGSIGSPIQFQDTLPTIPEETKGTTTKSDNQDNPPAMEEEYYSPAMFFSLLPDNLNMVHTNNHFQPDETILSSSAIQEEDKTTATTATTNHPKSSSSNKTTIGNDDNGELESWMAATFGISSDGIDQMLSPPSLNPSLCELVRSVERAVAGNVNVATSVPKKSSVEDVKGSSSSGAGPFKSGLGCGIDTFGGMDASLSRKGLKALDYLEL